MLTFNQIYSEAQDQIQDSSASMLITIKRGINQGMHKFMGILNREVTEHEKTFITVANQQYYQAPKDAIRIKSVDILIGNITYSPNNVEDTDFWKDLNMRVQTSSVPQFFYQKGSDQFGIWPVPNGAYSSTLSYERKARDMTQADTSTPGTISITHGQNTVVGAGTTFTSVMKGQYIFPDVAGGVGDGLGYKIIAVVDATHLTLENNYSGDTISGETWLVGEVPDIPDEFHEALVDYGLYRAYRRRRDLGTAKDLKAAFDEAVLLCEENYSSKTVSQYVRTPKPYSGYRQFKRDLTIP